MAAVASAAALVAALAVPAQAKAAVDFSEHTVSGVSPAGTTINLFDYWMTERWDADGKDQPGAAKSDIGINAGHDFWFVNGGEDGNGGINQWTGAGQGPKTGIVANQLQSNMPALAGQSQESLAYLFDPLNALNGAYKKAFTGVGGLLQIDDDGYYYYNSQQNFASFDEKTNNFLLYDSSAVKSHEPSNPAVPDGQFFPFNTAEQVFATNDDGTLQTSENGTLVAKDLKSTDKVFNHWFGMTMTTRFQQPEGGVADIKNPDDPTDDVPMTYEFSGDDDVWIFIDGVLVGDLGGIHDANRIVIDFATGKVTTYRKVTTDNPNGTELSETTIAEMFKKADVTTGLKGDTLADNTVHTLKFFYLERGNYASNMRLRFNLMSVPESSVVKVDQSGEPIANVPFELYGLQKDGTYGSQTLVAEGVTDEDGKLVLMSTSLDEEGQPFSFDIQETASGKRPYGKYVLHEARVPSGYRQGRDVKLQYHAAPEGEVAGGYVTSLEGDMWETGANVESGLQVTAPHEFHKNLPGDNAGSKGDKIPFDKIEEGTLFALVLKYEGNGAADLTDGTKWKAVSGNSLDGWSLQDVNNIDGAIAAAKKSPILFAPTKGNTYQATIEELPGDLSTYYQMIRLEGDNASLDDVRYTVAYYFTEASSLEGATSENTCRLYSEGTNGTDKFQRVFSTRLNVPNIKNRLFVQKTDTEWNPLQDGDEYPSATFSLYREVDVGLDPTDGVLTVKEGSSAYDTVATAPELFTTAGKFLMNNGAVFPSEGHVLARGVYYLIENEAPSGYKRWDSYTKVIVNNDGVFADAGSAEDDVRVLKGVGSLVQTMALYASGNQANAQPGDIDATLKDISITLQSGTPELRDDGINWGYDWKDVSGVSPKDLSYDTERAVLEYGPASGETGGTSQEQLERVTFAIDKGWGNIVIRQNFGSEVGDPSSAAKADLGDRALNTLFSETTTVQIANHAEGSLQITKVVENGAEDDETPFTVEVSLWHKADTSSEEKPVSGTYSLSVTDANGLVADQPDEITFKDGKATITLQQGWTALIGGTDNRLCADKGYGYTVTEKDIPSGFVQKEGSPTNDEGLVVRSAENTASKSNVVTVTNVYVIGFGIHKFDASEGANNKPLQGVEFELRDDLGGEDNAADGKYDPVADTRSALYSDKEQETLVSWPVATDGSGNLVVYGLQIGKSYWVVETKALDGYQLIKPMRFTVQNDGSLKFDYSDEAVTQKNGVATITISNSKVPALPKSGGIGNVPLYAAGTVLVGGSAYVISRQVGRRRCR